MGTAATGARARGLVGDTAGMANGGALLEMRSGSTGEDWIEVRTVQTATGERLAVITDGGLVRTEMLLDRESAEALRDALARHLG